LPLPIIIKKFTFHELISIKKKLIEFVKNNEDKRITKKTLNWFFNNIKPDGEIKDVKIIIAFSNRKLVGLFFIADYGKLHNAIIVDKKFRGQHIAKKLVDEMKKEVTPIYVRVAIDNIPSLNLFFHSGFVATDIVDGPTGKPTLIMVYRDNR